MIAFISKIRKFFGEQKVSFVRSGKPCGQRNLRFTRIFDLEDGKYYFLSLTRII